FPNQQAIDVTSRVPDSKFLDFSGAVAQDERLAAELGQVQQRHGITSATDLAEKLSQPGSLALRRDLAELGTKYKVDANFQPPVARSAIDGMVSLGRAAQADSKLRADLASVLEANNVGTLGDLPERLAERTPGAARLAHDVQSVARQH